MKLYENPHVRPKLTSKELKFSLHSNSKNTNDYQSLLTTQTTMNTNRNAYVNHINNLKKRNTFNRASSPKMVEMKENKESINKLSYRLRQGSANRNKV